MLYETFSVTEDHFSEHVTVIVRPGGATQDVTEANKEEYVGLVVAHRIAGRIPELFRAFMEGPRDVLPLDLLRVFDQHELELLIGGRTDRHGQLDAVYRLPRAQEDGPSDRVVLGVAPLIARGAQGAPAPIHHGHLARARQRLQESPGRRRAALLHNRKERRPEWPPAQLDVLQSPRPTAVRGL